MELLKYFKHKIIYFAVCFSVGLICFSAVGTAKARDNAYIACFIDDESFMYKTQVIYSGTEIELTRIGYFSEMDFNVNDDNLLNVAGYVANYQSDEALGNHITQIIGSIDNDTGKISIQATVDGDIVDGQEIDSSIWSSFSSAPFSMPSDSNWHQINALTFPAGGSNPANANDINRAYAVSSVLGDNYRDALLFINDGKSFTSVDALVDTAYALVSTNNEYITNQYGSRYKIEYLTNADDEYGYSYSCRITRSVLDSASSDSLTDRQKTFVYKIKKGYKGCDTTDYFEDGTSNNLNISKAPEDDTTYITWQQLFLEAGILYAEGVSYSNQADLYEVADFENSLVKVCRNFVSGIRNKLQLYSLEDCIFNNSIRGSQAFCYGIYQKNYNPQIFKFYMIILALALSFIMISIINTITKKELSTAFPMARYSIMNGFKDIILTVMLLSVLWLLMKLLFVCNFRFVSIWDTMLNGKTMGVNGGYNSLSAILYSFMFFVIQTYVNILYILRGLIIPFLMIIAPACVFVICLGDAGKKVALSWLKEFSGNLFIQSFHSLIYGFLLVSSTGLRGIESLVVCAAIIPLTSILKDITGVGGGVLLKKAASLSNSVLSTAGNAVQATTGAIGGAMNIAGNVMSTMGPAGQFMGSLAKAGGGLTTAAGGLANAGIGAGLMTQLDSGGQNMSSGLYTASRGLGNAAGYMAGGFTGMTADGINQYRNNRRVDALSNGGSRMFATGNFDTSFGLNGMSATFANSELGRATPLNAYSRVDGSNNLGRANNYLEYAVPPNSPTDPRAQAATRYKQAIEIDNSNGNHVEYESMCRDLGVSGISIRNVKGSGLADGTGTKINEVLTINAGYNDAPDAIINPSFLQHPPRHNS